MSKKHIGNKIALVYVLSSNFIKSRISTKTNVHNVHIRLLS